MYWYRILGILPLIVASGCARHADCARAPINSVSNQLLSDPSDAVFVSAPGGRNLTSEFTQRFNASTNTECAKAFEGCDVLLIHGWLGEVAIKLTSFLDTLKGNQRILDYLKDQRCAADEMGLCAAAPAYRSETVCACGDKIARIIASNPRPVILVCHSKGCLDTLDALLKLQRSGQLNNVAGWIALQGPFYGTEEAATFLNRGNPIGRLRIRMLGANPDGVRDMTPAVRKQYMAENQTQIATLIQSVPMICFASWTTPARENEALSDGHVTPESAILPGSDYIAKCGISHSMPVIGRKNTPFDRVTFTKTMLTLLGERVHSASKKQ